MQVLEACRVLAVKPGDDPVALRRAYHRLVKRYHPDLTGDSVDRDRLERVVDAYRVLCERRPKVVPFARRAGQGTVRSAAARRGPVEIGPAELATLGHLVLHSRNASTRAFSARRLGYSGKRSAYGFLRRALFDADPLVVKSAVRAIGMVHTAQGAAELGSVFCRGDGELKHLVLDVIEKSASPARYHDTLLVGLRDGEPSVRRRCLSLYARASAGKRQAEVG